MPNPKSSCIVLCATNAEVRTFKGEVFIIDLEDVPKIQGRSWRRDKDGYAISVVRSQGKRSVLFLHRMLLDAPKDVQVDHTDGDPSNNLRSNLRLCAHQENGRNRRRSTTNTSGFKGVSWDKQARCWRAYIKRNYKNIHLGLFDTPEQASVAYQAAAERLFGEFKRAKEHE